MGWVWEPSAGFLSQMHRDSSFIYRGWVREQQSARAKIVSEQMVWMSPVLIWLSVEMQRVLQFCACPILFTTSWKIHPMSLYGEQSQRIQMRLGNVLLSTHFPLLSQPVKKVYGPRETSSPISAGSLNLGPVTELSLAFSESKWKRHTDRLLVSLIYSLQKSGQS